MALASENGRSLIDYPIWSPNDIVSAAIGQMNKCHGLVYADIDNEGKGTLKRKRGAFFFLYRSARY